MRLVRDDAFHLMAEEDVGPCVLLGGASRSARDLHCRPIGAHTPRWMTPLPMSVHSMTSGVRGGLVGMATFNFA